MLLIVRVLDDATLRSLHRAADDLGLGVLVETHTAVEIRRAIDAGAAVIGVNARDLDDFSIDREAAWRLLMEVPATLLAVAESGMASPDDVATAAAAGADAVLIGGALAAHGTPEAAARSMAGIARCGR